VTSVASSVVKWIGTARPAAGVLLLILISLFSTVKLTKPTEQFASRFAGIVEVVPDRGTLYEHRFSVLRAVLPRHGTVGYVADQDSGYSDETVMAVQYALAPVLVERGPRHALVVGNITQPMTDPQQFLRQRNLTLIKDLGQGVLLLEGAPR